MSCFKRAEAHIFKLASLLFIVASDKLKLAFRLIKEGLGELEEMTFNSHVCLFQQSNHVH